MPVQDGQLGAMETAAEVTYQQHTPVGAAAEAAAAAAAAAAKDAPGRPSGSLAGLSLSKAGTLKQQPQLRGSQFSR